MRVSASFGIILTVKEDRSAEALGVRWKQCEVRLHSQAPELVRSDLRYSGVHGECLPWLVGMEFDAILRACMHARRLLECQGRSCSTDPLQSSGNHNLLEQENLNVL